MKPRDFFPTMPNEVFETWLEPLIDAKGWPFSSIEDDLKTSYWRYLLGIDTTLSDWASSSWSLVELDYPVVKLDQGSIFMLQEIVSNCVLGRQTSTANLENTKGRFDACATFIRDNVTLPHPVVLLITDSGYRIRDGHHRLAAFAFVHRHTPKPISFPAWVVSFN